ncbi:CheY-like chemotaxis protein [Pararhizobium capsulatum DSM 1112]|uniref:CheY-like chemotaxis protein n=1 Tax=Pararhizobium capsulatum DSM 1112 TaxID=1121113 RepID=A0ABU0BL52_9HYPH|nr:response regulator [Pararhizobium capsulatum]MDQ0318974.1 CheY-like chemotaxis protein [Pararhizobium capsulatum DSM 1112]
MYEHTVLVVEDDPLIRLTLSECLQDEGYAVVEAGNVLEAIAVLGKHDRIDAMVTDIDMPGSLNGLDLARLVRGCDSKTVIIVASGGQVVGPDELPDGGCFLAKPYRMADLFSILLHGISRPPRGHLEDTCTENLKPAPLARRST